MRRNGFSIGGLMGLVLVIALGLVGLKQANPIWASGSYTVALVVLVIGVLNAIQGRERARAFWVGFAVSGWAYFVCVFGIGSESVVAAPPVLVGLLLDRSQPLLHPSTPNSISFAPTQIVPTAVPTLVATPPPAATMTPAPPSNVTMTLTAPTPVAWTPTPWTTTWTIDTISVPFRQIGHSLAMLIVAYLGGLYSLFAASRRARRRDESAPGVGPTSTGDHRVVT